jgi:ribosomal subunit interface protein
MHFEVTFRNLNPREEVRRRAEALYNKLDRFLDPAAQAQMTVGIEHGMALVELVVTSRGTTYKVAEEDEDLRTSLDRAMHALENQLRRAKEKRTNRKGLGTEDDGFGAEGADEEEPSVA